MFLLLYYVIREYVRGMADVHNDYIGDILANMSELLSLELEVVMYEAEWLVNAMSPLPCLSLQEGEERNAESIEGTAGFNVYELPVRIIFYTAPTDDESISDELRDARATIKGVLFNANKNNLLHDSVIRFDYVSSKIMPIYDMDTRSLFSNAVLLNYTVYYEVIK